jgi:pyruvate formate lyase activating enzyme
MDYPDKLSTVIFTQGCNFRCPYCHNTQLISLTQGILPAREVFAFLDKNRDFLDGIVVTGGEPTLQKNLLSFLAQVKEMNILVKIDTNGSHPEILTKIINRNLADYIAMDLKSNLTVDDYTKTLGVNVPIKMVENIKESARLIIASGLPHEFRTTLARELIDLETIDRLLPLIDGCNAYYLQSVVSDKYSAYSKEVIDAFIDSHQRFNFLQSRSKPHKEGTFTS